jgi:hypothetical protein
VANDPLSSLGVPATPATPSAAPTADPLAALGTPASPSPELGGHVLDPGVAGALNKVGEFGAGIVPGAVEAMGDTIQHLPWVGKKILSPEAMQAEREYFKPGSPAEKAGQTTGSIAEPVLEFVLGDEALKGVALADKLGIAGKIAKIAQDSPYIGKLLQHGVNAARMGTVGATEALAKGATPENAVKAGVATGVAGEAIPAASSTVEALAARSPQAGAAVARLTNPFKQLLTSPKEAGLAATQEPGAAAIRTAVGAPAGAPVIEGATSIVDDMLAKTGVQKDVAYKQIDDMVGFDLKAEKQKLADTRYAIKQPGADVEGLQAEIDASTRQIADANKKLVEAGINPKVADQLNTAWEATKQFKNDIVRSTSSDGTINVKQLLNRGKNLRFNPRYGDRLAQAFGKGDASAGKAIADEYMRGLEAAQKAGVDAFKSQRFKLWLGGILGGAAITTGGVEGVKALLAP